MKILIVLGHPDKTGFNGALASAYFKGARNGGHEVKRINLGDLEFDLILHKGYKDIQELEPDLKDAQKYILWADHLVFVFPVWWGSFPAILKGFIDRVFLPGFAFKYRKDKPLPDQLLKGKTGRIITTMDAPVLFYQTFVFQAGVKILKTATLGFCGVKPVRKTLIGSLLKKTDKEREEILGKIKRIGERGK